VILLLAVASAWADPVALRAVGPEESVVVAAGLPESSVGLWRGRWGVSADVRWPGSAVGVSAGWRDRLAGKERGWRVDAFAAGSFVVPTIDPGVAVGLTPAIQGGWHGDRFSIALGAASPAVLRVGPGPAARAPLHLELRVGALRTVEAVGYAGVTAGDAGPVAFASGVNVVVTVPRRL
jgi:hypothetical protein